MKPKIITFLLILCSGYAMAQHDTTAITINNKPITISELRKAHSAAYDKDIDTFLKSFVDYKLIVEEALTQKLDTTSSFRRESSSARAQTKKMFDIDSTSVPKVVNQIYNRMLQDVDINQVFIPYQDKETLLPSDTLKLYKQAQKVAEALAKKGQVGKEWKDYAKATNLIADWTTLSGHLGWMVPLIMPEQVERAMYSLEVGAISEPIRTNKGYHVIQVLGRRPSRGKVVLEQVMFDFRVVPPSKKEIDSLNVIVSDVYKTLLKNPTEYGQLCDAFRAAKNLPTEDCHMGVFGLKENFPSNFLNKAFELKSIGDFSAPILTDYGIHIIRLKDVIALPSLAETRNGLQEHLMRGDRRACFNQVWYSRMTNENNLVMNKDIVAKIEQESNKVGPLDILFATAIQQYESEILFTINNIDTIYVSDFLDFLSHDSNISMLMKYSSIDGLTATTTDKVRAALSACVFKKIEVYTERTIEDRIPEFKTLMQKYNEGLLVYDAKNENVWNKVQITEKMLAKHFKEKTYRFGNEIRTLDDARADVEADLMNDLEQDWINTLRGKYSVKINDEVVNKLR